MGYGEFCIEKLIFVYFRFLSEWVKNMCNKQTISFPKNHRIIREFDSPNPWIERWEFWLSNKLSIHWKTLYCNYKKNCYHEYLEFLSKASNGERHFLCDAVLAFCDGFHHGRIQWT